MKDFFDTWKFKILVGIAVFLVGIMAYAGANGRLTAAPQELLSVAAAPFQKVAAVVSGGVASLWEKYTSIDDVMAENETLKAENAELRQQMVDYDRVKAENQAYKALESIQSQRPEMSYLSSFVIGRDPLDSFYGFTLDRGTLDGVAVNDAVVSDQGYLLGMVVEAEPTSCKVMTILHPSFSAAGVVSRTRENGIITGVQTLITLPYGIGSFIMGGLYAVTVVAGIHHMYTLIDLGQLARYGYTYWLPLASAANVAQGGAALAVALKSKDTKVKSMALPSALSACMGITEPAIFGVNLRYFKPFLGGLLGGACGAWYASIVGLGATGTGVTGIFGILLHLHMPLQYIIMMAISFGVSFAVTWLIWSPEEVKA